MAIVFASSDRAGTVGSNPQNVVIFEFFSYVLLLGVIPVWQLCKTTHHTSIST